jgi:uncharacterized membrane protein YidH (DUF202 family)
VKLGERAAPVAAAIAALSTLACCLPLGLAGAVGALGLSVVLSSLRPWLIAIAVIFLAVGLFQLYRNQRSCKRRSPVSLVIFGACAAVVVAVLALPQRVAELMAVLP